MRWAFVVMLVVAARPGVAEEGAWPQWRGPHRDGTLGQSADAFAHWPDQLEDQSLQPHWTAPLGPGYSGPIVGESLVYVTETKDRRDEVVSAFDRQTGELVWTNRWPGAMTVPFFAKANGDWIRATPALADGRLFVAGMQDVLVALDAADGTELWRFDAVNQLGASQESFGHVCSPLVDAGAVFIHCGAGLIKLSADSGEVLWRTLDDGGGMSGGAFSSPVIATIAGERQLVVQARTKLIGLNLDNGGTLWSIDVEAFRGMNILTPTVVDDRIFTSSYGGGAVLFEVTRNADAWAIRPLWKTTTQAYMSSPVVVDGNLYLHLRNQRFTCLDFETGDERWTSKPFGKYASLITNGRDILALDESGTLLMIRATPDAFELLGSQNVADKSTWAHLAVAGDQIFIRALDGLRVYRWADRR